MREIDVTGLMPRSAREYREILRVALNPDGTVDQDRVATWSQSRRVVLKAALRRAGIELVIGKIPKGVTPDLHIERAAKEKRVDLHTPSELDVQRLRAAYGTMPRGERAGVYLLLQMGLRANEVLSLTRREVEGAVESGDLSFTRKGDYKSILPARHAGPLFEELLGAAAKCGRPWKRAGEVFSCGAEGTQYVRMYRLCRSLGAHIGFRRLRPHLLRHAFASQMIRRGAPIAVVQKALGHADSKTTFRYIHADKSDVEKFVEVWNPEEPS